MGRVAKSPILQLPLRDWGSLSAIPGSRKWYILRLPSKVASSIHFIFLVKILDLLYCSLLLLHSAHNISSYTVSWTRLVALQSKQTQFDSQLHWCEAFIFLLVWKDANFCYLNKFSCNVTNYSCILLLEYPQSMVPHILVFCSIALTCGKIWNKPPLHYCHTEGQFPVEQGLQSPHLWADRVIISASSIVSGHVPCVR